MTAATIPTGSRASVLADLRKRRNTALDLASAAETEGDEQRWRRINARFWLRELQISYIERIPAQSLCPQCVMGDEGWQPDLLTGSRPVWSCLEHWTPALEREAAQMAQTAHWLGRR